MAPMLSPVEWTISLFAFGSTVIGAYIGYQAYRGFRRHQSRAMQYLSLGLILLTTVAFGVSFVGSVLLRQGLIPLALEQPLTLFVRLSQFVGLALIAYSLHRRP